MSRRRVHIQALSIALPLSAACAHAIAAPEPGPPAQPRDEQGIAMLYATKSGGPSWTSAHWSRTKGRELKGKDPEDPRGASTARGNGQLTLDDEGALIFSGEEPRLYLGPALGPGFSNVEVTVYFERDEDAAVPWAGIVIGARSGAEGHTDAGRCEATTYYGRLRNDGFADLEKELMHPESAARASRKIWPEGALPRQTWLGMKLAVYDQEDGVHLELFLDRTNGANGGRWEKLTETVDRGDWSAPSRCAFPENHVIRPGGGVVLIRNTKVRRARYKWVSVREIEPPKARTP